MAIVKTVVMMTGEYEYGDLFAPTSTDNPNVDNSTSEISTADNSTVPNFDSDDERYSDFTPFYGRIVFVFFILINFVFVNMVIALTVCDTQEVANEVRSLHIACMFHGFLQLCPGPIRVLFYQLFRNPLNLS